MHKINQTTYKPMFLGLIVSMVLLLVMPMAYGQSTSWARVYGTVSDQTGGVIPGAEVGVLNKATNVLRNTLSNARGDYLVDQLVPGLYDISVELPGFKKQVATDVSLAAEQRARVDLVLTPGEIAETVTVRGTSTAIETATAEMASVIEEKQIIDLPIGSNRNVMLLSELVTGAVQARFNTNVHGTGQYGRVGLPAVNGNATQQNNILFDGANNKNLQRGYPAIYPSPETLQEFKVITTNYSAEYGRMAGMIINMVSKSGTNQFHGHAWYYFRDEGLNANSYFANRAGIGKLPLSQDQFGGAVGGPIVKDRTFFFATYERLVRPATQPGFSTVPTAAELRGDFSLGDGTWGSIPIFDPFNVVDGQRVQFPNNQIPTNRMNPIAQTVLQSVPYPTANQDDFPNYAFPSERNSTENKYSIRLDHQFSSNDRIFGRISWMDAPETYFRANSVGLPGHPHGVYQNKQDNNKGKQAAGSWIKTISTTLISDFNFAYHSSDFFNRTTLFEEAKTANYLKEFDYDIKDQVDQLAPDGLPGPVGLPTIRPEGYSRYEMYWCCENSGHGVDFKETVSWSKGDHYLKFGFENLRQYNSGSRWVAGTARNDFDGFSTGEITRDGDGNITGSAMGQPFADFLLGTASGSSGNVLGGGGYGIGGFGKIDESIYSAFVQDDWRVTQDLTLNLGVRYENFLPATFQFNKAACFFEGGRDNPTQIVPKGIDLLADYLTGGDLSNLAIPFKENVTNNCTDRNNFMFAPRFGLSWRMFGSNRTVLRLGAGLSRDNDYGVFRGNTGYIGPYAGRIASQQQERGFAPRLFLGQHRDLPLAKSEEHITSYFYEKGYQPGKLTSFNLSIQHELFPGTRLEVAYVGNQGRHMINRRAFNAAQPEGFVIPSDANVNPGLELTGSQKDRRPIFPRVAPNFKSHSDAATNYNSLQVKLDRRFQDQIGFHIGYTWGKSYVGNSGGAYFEGVQNEYNRAASKGRPRWDRTQSFFTSLVWELPFFQNASGMTRGILGGWEFTSIMTLASGLPYGPVVATDIYDLGSRRNVLPHRICDGQLSEGSRTVDRFFDASCFVMPTGGEYGNSSRHPLDTDGIANVDLGFHKDFVIGEGKEVEFRVEMFNALNHTMFDVPCAGNGSCGRVGTANFGKVRGSAFPREIQFGFRFRF